jgi:hypothetical protein
MTALPPRATVPAPETTQPPPVARRPMSQAGRIRRLVARLAAAAGAANRAGVPF